MILKIEVNIDYPEYEDEEQITTEYLKPVISELIRKLKIILEKSETSAILKDGISTAIIGRPNVGKSSLLNSLLKEDKAIVTDIAGTTGILWRQVDISGVILNLIDTRRGTEDVVEKIGVEKAKMTIENPIL